MSAIRHREEVLNTVLAEALVSRGVHATPEAIINKGKALPDVILDFRGLRLVIEGKVDDVKDGHRVVSKQAVSRIEDAIAHISMAVVYPSSLRETPFADLKTEFGNCLLEFRVFSENGASTWRKGRLHTIMAELRRIQEHLARDDAVQQAASDLRERLDGIADLFAINKGVCDRLTEILGVGVPKKEKAAQQAKRRIASAKIGALAVANAFIFQEQLCAADSRVQTLRTSIAADDVISYSIEHWGFICDTINYVPIFLVAKEILLELPSDRQAEKAVLSLAKRAQHICQRKAALRHDLMGRIYHWLLHDAKYLGTYYTSVPAATILLKIALNPSNVDFDFSKSENLKNFKVADLACGTGTLLMAASQAITDNFVRRSAAKQKKVDGQLLTGLHRELMENVLHGYDVLTSAIHLTASTLALLAPEIAFRKMHLYTMPLGVRGTGDVRLGSIDFIDADEVSTQVALFDGGLDGSTVVTGQGMTESVAVVPDLDLCVMNPPFTRSVGGNLLFGSLPDERGQMQTKLKSLLRPKNRAPLMANSTAGLGSVFIAVAHPHIKESGRIALVLPAALLNGVAWGKSRKLLAQEYSVEVVVVSHDARRWSFSENTSLSETLLVAQKRPSDNAVATFINLWHNPATIGDALAVASAINEIKPATFGTENNVNHSIAPVKIGDKKIGEAVAISLSEIGDALFGCCFAQTELVRQSWFLRKGYFVEAGIKKGTKLPIRKLGSLVEIGPDRRDIYDGFTIEDTHSSYPAFWGHAAADVSTLATTANKWLSPRVEAAKGRKLRDINLLWPRAGKILIAEKMRLNTQKMVCLRANQAVLSNVWWPCKFSDSENAEKKEKALCLWLNSTLGIMLMVSSRVPTEGPWVQFKKPTLKDLPVLDVASLPEDKLTALAKAYDAVAKSDLLPLSSMKSDPVRADLDKVISTVLQINDLEPTRQLLGQEPVITAKAIGDEVDWAEDAGVHEQLSFIEM